MNTVNLIGRLTKDIELSKTQTGKTVGRFTLAIDRYSSSEEKQADFIRCVVWEKRAETMYQNLSKGNKVGIVGRIQTGSYQNNGTTVYTTDVIVENFTFCESKKAESYQEDVAYNDYGEKDDTLDIDSDDLPF